MILTTTYEVVQKGLVLSCEKIAINKYENKVTKLHFTFDENITGGRHYVALLNPVTKTYKISPLNTEDTAILSAEMSRFPGIWQLILIATGDDYEIVNDEIDQTKCTYVSNIAKFILVRDNFLSDETIEYEESPAIQQLIDETVAMRDQLEQYALGANEDYNKAHAEVERVALFVEEAQSIKEEIESLNELIFGYESDADKFAKLSEAWAVGRPDIEGSETNNAKYYAGIASSNATEAINANEEVKVVHANASALKEQVETLKSEMDNTKLEIDKINADASKAMSDFNNRVEEATSDFDTHVANNTAGIISQAKAYTDSAVENKADRSELHSHGNAAILNDITAQKVASWDAKSEFSGNYEDLSDKPTSLPASDVYDWAKAPSKPVYTAAEVGALPASTKIPSIEGLATTSYVDEELTKKANSLDLHSHSNKSVIDDITLEKVRAWDAKSEFSGDYNDLLNKPEVSSEIVVSEVEPVDPNVKIWINPTESNGLIFDDTLSVEGAIPDSKIVGDKITQLYNAFSNTVSIEITYDDGTSETLNLVVGGVASETN